MFRNRQDAGQKLASELSKLNLHKPIVLALPRGGVPVAIEISRALKAPIDLVIVRKVGAPGNPELAIAAIVDGNPPDVVLNREIIEAYGLDDAELRALIDRERPELARRKMVYRGGRRQPASIGGKTVIVVDDGVATGTTMKAVVRALKRRSPREIIVAVPVAPPDSAAELAREADRIVCLSQPARFQVLGYYYRDFPQLSDDDVIAAFQEFTPCGSRPSGALPGSTR
jgi:putative phosphoribosyl transferase